MSGEDTDEIWEEYRKEVKEEEDLLDELVPELEEALEGYDILDLEGEVYEEREDGSVRLNKEFPHWNFEYGENMSGAASPTIFIVEEGMTKEEVKNGDYAIGVDPGHKIAGIRKPDPELIRAFRDFVEEWEDRTYLTKKPLNDTEGEFDRYFDVSEVTYM